MMVYSAQEVTAPNMNSSPSADAAAARDCAKSPREITIHTPSSAIDHAQPAPRAQPLLEHQRRDRDGDRPD